MFNLLRFFTICSLIACLVASLLLGVFYRQSMINDLVGVTEEKNIALGNVLIGTVQEQLYSYIRITADQASPKPDMITALHAAIATQIRNSPIVKVKIYNLAGLTIFSTEAAQIGEDKRDNAGVQNAIQGKTLSELAHRDTFSAFDRQLENLDVLGTYLPIYQNDASGKVLAVLEIYSEVTTLVQRIDATQWRVVTGILAAFGTLYGILWLIVRYASHILQRQYATIQAGEQALLAQKANLQQTIDERTTALQQSHRQMEYELQERQADQERLQRYSERLQVLRELDQGTLAAKSPQDIAEVALHHLRRLVPCERASVVIFDYAAKEGIVLAASSRQISTLVAGAKVPFASFTILQRFDPLAQPAEFPLRVYPTPATDLPLLAAGITHIVQVPLVNQQELIGSLNIGAKDAQTIQAEHLDIARDVANLLAIAIQQARLHEQVNQQATELHLRVGELQRTEAALDEERQSLARRVEQRTADLQTANRELAKSARLKDEFLAAVSHELRTPLTTILAHTELLQKGVYGALVGKQHDSTAIIYKAGNHLLALINDLLDLSRLQEGKLQLQSDLVTITEISQTSIELVEPLATAKQITLTLTVDSQLTTLMADRRRLLQVLINLLDNAIKFTPTGGQVGLEVVDERAAALVHFAIWDSGIGIAPADQERIFQPFVQLDASLARNFSGAGLGLAMTQRLVQLHGGEIRVISTVGQGSRFTVSLPWQLPQPASNHEQDNSTLTMTTPVLPTQPAADGANLQVLIAEDNDLNREFLAEVLQISGYKPLLAQNGAEALDMARQHHPALILMDVQMPIVDGLSAIRQLRAQGNQTPILALTGLAMREDEERCLAAGANAYISKPLQIDHLLAMIAAYADINSRT